MGFALLFGLMAAASITMYFRPEPVFNPLREYFLAFGIIFTFLTGLIAGSELERNQ